MVVLGLDPGFSSCGWALLDLSSARPRAIAAGVIRTKPGSGLKLRKCEDNVARLQVITEALSILHEEHKFAVIAAEAQSWTRFPNSDRAVAMAWGAIAATAEIFNCPIIQIRPQDVKKQLVGDASASKAAVQAHLENNVTGAEKELSKITASQQNHASDAMACALASRKDKLIRTVLRIRSGD